MTEEEKAAIAAAREARKAEKERLKAEKAAKQAAKEAEDAENSKIKEVTYLSVDEQSSYQKMGDMTLVMSRSRTNRNFATVADLENKEIYPTWSNVWLR